MKTATAKRAVSAKQRRRAHIRQLLHDRTITGQEQLATLLSEAGVKCTQATLSRDLRDLGVTREHGPEGVRYKMNPDQRYLQALREIIGMEILQVKHNGTMVVIHTLTGRAQGVAAYLDAWENDLVLGTLAGDDTVFVAPTSTDACERLARAIRSLVTGEETP